MKKRLLSIILVVILLLTSCGEEKKEAVNGQVEYQVSYLNSEMTGLVTQSRFIYDANAEDTARNLIALMGAQDDPALKGPLDFDYSVLDIYRKGSRFVVNLDEKYNSLDSTVSVLIRGAIVRTVTQVAGIKTVKFMIEDMPLCDLDGNPMGDFVASDFLDSVGNETGEIEDATVFLYFANETGDRLVKELRSIEYNNIIPLERIIMELLIGGPKAKGAYPVVNKETELLSISVKDEICYVNLSQNFLTRTVDVTADVTVFSIVNSLTELPNISKVQLLIEGESDLLYNSAVPLGVPYEKNGDLTSPKKNN